MVVTFNSLYDNFEMRIAHLFYFGNKNLKEIQQIVTSTEVANLAKRAVRTTINFVMIAKKKQLKKYHNKL